MKALTASLLLGAGLLAAPAAQAAWVWTGWAPIQMSQGDCTNRGRSLVANAGFQASGDAQTVFGWRGEDNISIRCIADSGLAVFFVYVRTSSEDGRAVLDQMRRGYGQSTNPGSKF